jgi:UDP:flavonoid glycosyltransferase YjiC (YdhE family)
VIEPGEFATEDDPGITAGRDGESVRVAPVTLFEPRELLDREAARGELGLDPGRIAVVVQLGARNNFDYGQIDRVVLDTLGRRVDVQLVFVDWLIGENAAELPAHIRRVQDFPVARYLRAFDLAVSACGYNSFHELLGIGLPAILVPNENPMMDAQEIRALWADRRGHAVCVRVHEIYRLAWALERLLQPDIRERVAQGAARLPPCDGAREAAALVADLAGSQARADRHGGRPTQALLRSF